MPASASVHHPIARAASRLAATAVVGALLLVAGPAPAPAAEPALPHTGTRSGSAAGLGADAGLDAGAGPRASAGPRADAGPGRARPRLSWPLAPPWRILRGYEAPPTRYAAGHRGIDLAAAAGAPVLSPAEGKIAFRGRVVDRDVVTIDAGGSVLVSLEPVSSDLDVGDVVHAGQEIGTVSTGGHCADRCLHLGVRRAGEYVSPLLYLADVPRAVLLPLR